MNLRTNAALIVSLLSFAAASQGKADSEVAPASAALSTLIHDECDSNAASSDWPRSGNARQTAAATFFTVVAGASNADIDRALRNEMTVQSLDRASPDFGRIVDPVTPADTNDTAFGAEAWGPMLLRYSQRLSPETVADLRTHAGAALAYFAHHPVDVNYTNIHLLTAMEEVLLGDSLSDRNSIDRGVSDLDAWVRLTAQDGIHEFDSPTYYALDLDALSLGATFATEDGQRREFARAQDYLWKEIAANTFVPNGRIAGAQSRSYDPLDGADGPMSINLLYAGFAGRVTDTKNIHCFDSYTFARDLGAYSIPSEARDIAAKTPRTVTQRMSGNAQDTKYTYVTADYAIGSSNEGYDQTERVAAIDLKGSSTLPVVRIMGDKTGTYYGPTAKTQIDGERIWNHVQVRPAIAQQHNYLVALTDLDGGQAFDGGPLTLNVLFPAAGRLMLDGSPIDLSSPQARIAGTDGVASVQIGNAIAAARIAYADYPSGNAAVNFASDSAGLDAGVVRLYATLADRTPAVTRDLKSIVIMGAESGAEAEKAVEKIRRAKIASSVIGTLWNVHVELAGHRYDIVYDLRTHRSRSRTIDGKDVVVDRPLNVDGVAVDF